MKDLLPVISSQAIPFLTVDQMKEVDRLMIDKYKITLIQMMENASLNLARLIQRYYPDKKTVIILAGKGNNGGGGLGAGRRLYNWGYHIIVLLGSNREEFKSVPLRQLEILENMGIEIVERSENFQMVFEDNTEEGIILDALLGYNLKGNPRDNYAILIKYAISSGMPIISLDIPSGVEGTTGTIFSSAIRANMTLTLALPKTAFLKKEVQQYSGELFVADISVPPDLYSEMNLIVSKELFQKSSIVKIDY
ncbi:MAG: NAD(P)H-hydrate epimerase [Candidatus Heimdallarchaeota archaeon]